MSESALKKPASQAYVVPPPPIAALPVEGSDELFPINRVFCIGRNYAAHAVEMGHDPDKEPPFFFQKNRGATCRAKPRSSAVPGKSARPSRSPRLAGRSSRRRRSAIRTKAR